MNKLASSILSNFAEAIRMAGTDHPEHTLKLAQAMEAFQQGDKVKAEALIEDVFMEIAASGPDVLDD